jgi:NAD+ kinase
MDKISVISKLDDKSISIKEYIIKKLVDKGYIYDEEQPDLVFTVGGDGTFLYAVHKYLEIIDKVFFIPIHNGTLGFVAEYTASEVDECLKNDFTNDVKRIYKYPLLECELDSGKKFYAVNEIRAESIRFSQNIDVFINQQYFESFRGNGILVCTQFGSTAYNRSLNGAVIDAGVPCIEMTEIAGLSHSNYRSCRSSIIFKNTTEIVLNNKNYDGISLIYDQFEFKLTKEKSLKIKQCSKEVKMLSFKNIPYLTRIKYLF